MNKKSYKTEFKEPQAIHKLTNTSKIDRVNKNNQIRQNKLNSYLLQKRGIIDKDGESTIQSINATNLTALIDYTEYVKAPKAIVLIALNEEADLVGLAKEISSMFNQSEVSIRGNCFTGIIPNDIVKGKERITITLCSQRSIHSSLDFAKVCDLIIFVSSSKAKHDCSKLNLDPYTSANPIDSKGYDILSALRIQGMLPHIVVIQHMEIIPDKNKSDFKKLYTRYFETELQSIKIITLMKEDDYKSLLRSISFTSTFEDTYNLRKHRSYMLCDTYYAEQSKTNSSEMNLIVRGYIKGNTMNNFTYCHLTGFGDYIALEVNDEIEEPCPISKYGSTVHVNSKKNENDMKVDENKKKNYHEEIINPEANSTRPIIIGDKFKEDKLNRIDKDKADYQLNKDLDDLINFTIDPKEEDISFHENDEDENFNKENLGSLLHSKKHEAKTNLYYRNPNEMDVADEVDTPIDVPCRERFSKYRGVSSMAVGSMDPSINLPKEYNSIYSFENIKYTWKESIKSAHENGMRISGKYIQVTLKNFKDFHLLNNNHPLILSTLLEHERKLCIMHMKVNKRDEYTEELYSKQLVEIQIGFRRILSRPVYSRQVGDTDKFKKERKLENGKQMIASLYCQLIFPGSPVIVLKPKTVDLVDLVASGTVINSDCNKIILKKIVLTGYPFKIHKKRAVVRYMFFNPEDVNYFKPIPLVTKFGLRGNITESLGTHGYMKCTFSDNLKQNDIVCLALYKRVFPVWFPESWRLSLGYSNDLKYLKIFEDDTKEFENKEKLRFEVNNEDGVVNGDDRVEVDDMIVEN